MKLQIGDLVPDFTTEASFPSGEHGPWRLSEALKKGPVLLVFYPGDFTSVCTKQLCDYRDNWSQLNGLGVQVLGVSTNDSQSHAKFSQALKLPFPLLDDSKKEILSACGMQLLGGLVSAMSARGFVLIGSDQKVRYVFREALPFLYTSAGALAERLRNHLR